MKKKLMALTKAQQIEAAIRDGIVSGRWPVGSRLPGETSLMEEFGIGRSTFREAMSALAKEGLLVSRHGKGTFITGMPAARSIAICTRVNLFSAYQAHWGVRLLERMRNVVETHGYRALTVVAHGDTVAEQQASINFTDPNVIKDIDGVIALNGTRFIYDRIHEAGIKLVSITRPVPEERGFSVVLDYAALTARAAGILAAQGHDDFAVIYYRRPKERRTVDEDYYEEFEGLVRNAVNGDEARLIGLDREFSYETVKEAFLRWWERPGRGRALLVYDDSICEILCALFLVLGIRVPEDLSVITQGGRERDFFFPLAFTRIGFDPQRTALAAWQLLEAQWNAPDELPGTYVKVAPELFPGNSVAGRDSHAGYRERR